MRIACGVRMIRSLSLSLPVVALLLATNVSAQSSLVDSQSSANRPFTVSVADVALSPDAVLAVEIDPVISTKGVLAIGNARLFVRLEEAGALAQWVEETRQGKKIRKQISVFLFRSDKTPGRSYTLYEAFPVAFSTVDFTESGDVKVAELEVEVARIGIDGAAAQDSGAVQVTGTYKTAQGESSASSGYDSVSRAKSGSSGNAQLQLLCLRQGNGPTVTLKGQLQKRPIDTVVNAALAGDLSAKATIVLPPATPSEGNSFLYEDCYPAGYTFPRLDAGSADPITEEVQLRPVRYNDPA